MAYETTPDQRAAFQRDECRTNGHTFAEETTFGSIVPVAIICTNCGSRWRIHPDDVGRDFGR